MILLYGVPTIITFSLLQNNTECVSCWQLVFNHDMHMISSLNDTCIEWKCIKDVSFHGDKWIQFVLELVFLGEFAEWKKTLAFLASHRLFRTFMEKA